MKRLMTLAVVMMLATMASGCRSHSWFNRGAPCNACAPGVDPYMSATPACPTVGVPEGASTTYVPGPG